MTQHPHTPGPWKVGGPTHSVGITIWRGNEGDGPWARICRNVNTPEDAKLIAAAPALADALEVLLKMSPHAETAVDYEGPECPHCKAESALRAAGRIP